MEYNMLIKKYLLTTALFITSIATMHMHAMETQTATEFDTLKLSLKKIGTAIPVEEKTLQEIAAQHNLTLKGKNTRLKTAYLITAINSKLRQIAQLEAQSVAETELNNPAVMIQEITAQPDTNASSKDEVATLAEAITKTLSKKDAIAAALITENLELKTTIEALQAEISKLRSSQS
jgi:hypothetical protein